MADLSPNLPSQSSSDSIPFWRDGRVLGVLAQIAFLILFALSAAYLLNNVYGGLQRLGKAQFLCDDGSEQLRCFFDFLNLESQFDIAESVVPYSPADTYARAVWVGFLNTIKVSGLGIILATILGTFTGIARLSSNWLLSNIAKWYIDLMRNTPLVLILLFLYLVVLLNALPPINQAIQPLGLPVFLSQRGINFPKIVAMPSFSVFLAFVVLAIIQAQVLSVILGRREEKTGQASNRTAWALVSLVVVIGAGWIVAGNQARDDQALLVSRGLRVREYSDLEALIVGRLPINRLNDISKGLENGTLSQEQVDEAALQLCALRDSPSEVNLTAQLRVDGIPYSTRRFARTDQAITAYGEGECEALVAPTAIIAAERDVLPDAATHLVVPVTERPMRISLPRIEGLNFVGGGKLTPEFAAVLFGLTIYTAAFIAEIVRAGILSVSKGQSEAARALGLSESQRLRLIVLPQALRVIIPPLTSQYLNLTKNSSLAQFVAFPEIWTVSFTTINQSGRAVQIIIIVMATYLTISLSISALLNWYNQRIALVER
ncbi:MAG: ABC transporter permease subunit [Anaerolineales bacterium]|nr:ABC transporter permease subunit [Anaerolineales bacterium]MCB8950472.1 ABC transporter permease subunit [Ardenticatenales bacterium]